LWNKKKKIKVHNIAATLHFYKTLLTRKILKAIIYYRITHFLKKESRD